MRVTTNHSKPPTQYREVACTRPKTRTKRSNRNKTKLGLPDLEHVKSPVLVSLRSPESQRSYRRSIEDFVAWYCSEPRLSFSKTVVTRYRIHLEERLNGKIAITPIKRTRCFVMIALPKRRLSIRRASALQPCISNTQASSFVYD